MSKLLAHELETSGTLYQEITIGAENIYTQYIRLNLYKHGHPPGGMSVKIRDTNGKIIGSSTEVTVAAIDADITSADFFHGLVRFAIDIPLRKETTYQIALVANGTYAFNETASGSTGYIAWLTNFDGSRVDFDYSQTVGIHSALDLEIWGLKELTRG